MYHAAGTWRCDPIPATDPMRSLLRDSPIRHERCVYKPLGAGPGDTVTYRVDLPLPWGRDTEVTLPIQALVDDAWIAMEPNVSGAISKGAVVIAASVAVAVGLMALWIKKG